MTIFINEDKGLSVNSDQVVEFYLNKNENKLKLKEK